ncbi:uncharacterized protein N0V89_006086 [Didymosphaeria variabile]|uniref:NAD dependent epimerase/dehydratase n=1 Tax=Didymosphaeria variabile TaxID=1932322 RepID=A0A9W9CB28_9PLEO|nr:uncharacterized protein N0V89_006086 [Didymosphaeria variabile]KAJ4354351.1 hypothetical protein N0V89_006086 [Didymosphaeria variabile]
MPSSEEINMSKMSLLEIEDDERREQNSGTRLIDRDQRVRTKPMRVLVLGMCRTGTSSIRLALRKLGYKTHHMDAVIEEDPTQLPYWQEAVEVTFFPDQQRQVHLRGQPPYGRAEFDKLLANYDAVTDFPCALYAEQLVKAYPDAKVVLTNRDYDSWARSMESTIWWIFGSKLSYFCGATNLAPWPLGDFTRFNHACFKAHSNSQYKNTPEAKAAFDRHYALVRSIVPNDNLLEFGPKFEWEPLCEFLGKDVPSEPYPWANDGKAMKKRVRGLWALMAVYAGGSIGAPVAVAWAAWRWREAISGFLGSILRRN